MTIQRETGLITRSLDGHLRLPISEPRMPLSTSGAWTFRNRSWLPVPLLVLVILLSHRAPLMQRWILGGCALEGLGETLRLWAVRHIGVISRTRAYRLGPLITSGPYGWVRNPLYVGNWLLWTGVVVLSGVLWLVPVVWIAFAAQYALITRFEEQLLMTAYPGYREYMDRVPAWIPRIGRRHRTQATAIAPWTAVLVSERSTITAIVLVTALILWRA